MKNKYTTGQKLLKSIGTIQLLMFLLFLPDFLLCQSATGERINLGLYGGASNDFAYDTNYRIFSTVESPGSLFYSDDTCKTWTQAFPIDSLEYGSDNDRGWSGGRRVLSNRIGWIGVQTAEAGGTLNSSVISYDDGDSGTFKTAFDYYLLKQIKGGSAPMASVSAIDITDHWFYVAMGKYLLRTNDTATLGAHNIIVEMDTVTLADTSENIEWLSAANTPSGFPVLLIVRDNDVNYGRLLQYDGTTFTEIAHPVSGSNDYYYKKVFTHPVDTTQDTIFVSCIQPVSQTIKIFRSLNGGTTWTDITPSGGTNWHLQNADYSPNWVSSMPSSNGLRLSFPGGNHSEDMGNTWSAKYASDNATAAAPYNPDIIICSENTGPEVSYDGGATFTTPDNEGHAAVSISKIAQLRRNTYYVATKAGLGYTIAYHDSTVNGVQKWQPPYGEFPVSGVPSGVTAVDIDPTDSLHVIVGGSDGFYITTTGHSGFSHVSTPFWNFGTHQDYTVTDIQFITPDTVVAVTGTGSNALPSPAADYGNIWVSTDGGFNWTKLHPSDAGVDFEQGNSVAVSYGYSDTVIYIGTGYWDHAFPKVPGTIWKSTDFGTTWSFVNWGPESQASGSTVDSLPIYDLDVYPGTEDTLFIAAGQNLDFAFARSTDGGNTYSYINLMIPEGAFSNVMIHPDDPDIVSVAARRDLWRYNTIFNSITLVFEGMPGEFIPDLEYGSVIMGTSTGLYKLSEEPGSVTTIWRGIGDWSDASKWTNGIPYNICNAIIDSGRVNVDIDGEVYDLEIQPGAAMTINSSKNVSITGDFTLHSDDNGDASFIDEGTFSVSGDIIVERYISEDQWHYLTPPVSNSTAGIFTGLYLKYWDEPNNKWEYITSTGEPLLAGKGYASWSSGGTTGNITVSYHGTLNTGDYSPTVSLSGDTAANYGWNLIGNAYPSAFDWDDPSLVKTNIDNTVYYLDGTQYLTYNGTTHVGSTGISQYVPQQQGFFIHAYDNNPSITITQSSRTHADQQFLNNPYRVDNMLRMHVQGNGYKDETIIIFRDDATNGFDHDFDAYKLYGVEEAPQLYTVSGNTEMAMNVQPFDGNVESVPLYFKAGTTGTFTLWSEGIENFPEDMVITLEDTKTGEITDLRTDSLYTFTATSYGNPNRFILHFDATTVGIENHNTVSNEPVLIYVDGENMLNIKYTDGKPGKGNVVIYDVLGRQHDNFALSGTNVEKKKLNLSAGTYIVQVTSAGNTTVKRIFINKK